MDKNAIQRDLVAHLRAGLSADERDAASLRSAALVDEEDEHRIDDISHEDEAGDLHGLIDKADEREDELADIAAKLDMSPTDTVRPGAVIEMDGEHYVVGVASSSFESGGVAYSGISTDAPVYSVIEGKRSGDTYVFADGEHAIGAVN